MHRFRVARRSYQQSSLGLDGEFGAPAPQGTLKAGARGQGVLDRLSTCELIVAQLGADLRECEWIAGRGVVQALTHRRGDPSVRRFHEKSHGRVHAQP